MARRRREDPTPVTVDVPAEYRYRWLCRGPLLMFGGHKIAAAVQETDAAGGPVSDRLARLEAAYAEHGLLDQATRRLTALWEREQRATGGGEGQGRPLEARTLPAVSVSLPEVAKAATR